jgi:TRAP-type C4-dicarboxylate transport system substrate-binding protein
MPLSDVMCALQSGVPAAVALGFVDEAPCTLEVNQPASFTINQVSARWYAKFPADLQRIVDDTAKAEVLKVAKDEVTNFTNGREAWTTIGGKLVSLSGEEQTELMASFVSASEEVSKANPKLQAAYEVVRDAARRTAD